MRTGVFGWTGISLPVVGQGTAKLELEERGAVVRALRQGMDLGMTHVDTAELYGGSPLQEVVAAVGAGRMGQAVEQGLGRVEELVGEALQGRRDEAFLVSKVIPDHATYEGTLQACEQSLRRLKTDRLDLYLLHWPGPVPLEETFRAFERLVGDGKIRFFGVSNFTVPELEQALAVAGEGRIACNQVPNHLLQRSIERRLVSFCASHRIAVVAFSPFGTGEFPSPDSEGGRVLREIAEAHGATPHQVALRFLLRNPDLFTIPKATRLEHLQDNVRAVSLPLSQAELQRIDAAFPV